MERNCSQACKKTVLGNVYTKHLQDCSQAAKIRTLETNAHEIQAKNFVLNVCRKGDYFLDSQSVNIQICQNFSSTFW